MRKRSVLGLLIIIAGCFLICTSMIFYLHIGFFILGFIFLIGGLFALE